MKKKLVRIASGVFPRIITSFAYNKLTNPQVHKLRKNEIETLDKAHKERFEFKEFDIQLYTWKGGDKKVLLIHGWEGQAGNFSDLIEELLKNGYTVHSFDTPSHGASSKGGTSLFEFSELVGLLIRKNDIKTLISHSFGGVATTYALYNNTNLKIDKYVLLTTPDKFIERINDVSDKVGISPRIKRRLIQKLERETNMSVKALNVSGFVKFISVENALIFHDKNDKVIPIEQSRNVHLNWEVSEMREVEGTGHFRILRTKAVIDEVIEYLD